MLAQALVAERAQGRLLAALGEQVVDRLVRALQRAGDGGRGGVERLRDLGGREAEHVAQDQRRALARGQVLERRDERQLDALALLVPSLRPDPPVRDPRHPVGQRLEPDRLGQRRAGQAVRLRRRPVVDRQHPLRPPLDHPQAAVRRDPVQPAPQRAAALEPGRARASCAAARSGARPRRRAASRASGSSARAARSGTARSGPRTRARRRARRLRASGGRGRDRGSLGLRPGWRLGIHRSVLRFVTNCALRV